MTSEEKIDGYKLVNVQLEALLAGQNYTLSNLSNATALLYQFLSTSIFVGFYLYDGHQLILGPFQGGVSCVEIGLGTGVCGQSAQERKTIIVEDVSQHRNYISCDSRARSEIVVPVIKDERLIGVLDLDSPDLSAYDSIDQTYLEDFVQILVDRTDFTFFEVGAKN